MNRLNSVPLVAMALSFFAGAFHPWPGLVAFLGAGALWVWVGYREERAADRALAAGSYATKAELEALAGKVTRLENRGR